MASTFTLFARFMMTSQPLRSCFLAIVSSLTLATLPTQAVVVSGTGNFTDPSDAVAVAGSSVYGINHDGVAELLVTIGGSNFRSSSALLWTGKHVLTAAHSVDNGTDGGVGISSGQIRFRYGAGNTALNINITPDMVIIHPTWNSNINAGYDLAIIELDEEVNPFIPRYNIFDGDSEDLIGETFTMFGYGRTGTGTTGDTQSSGTKRFGQNEYDDTNFLSDILGDTVLWSDFDNGLADQNAFESTGSSTGLGDREADTAGGDSGGPSFVEDPDNPGEYLIAGVTSFSARTGSPPDTNGVIDDTFGELKGDTDVSVLSSWVYSVVPEPTTGSLLLGAGLVALLRRRRKA